ncbi:LCP family protein [Actinomycetospora cinnamomea]|uniref:LytR family transcriptional attenuator n=1 Tax=Actinomycetospora cinnamomea TaxID=663609 RepID=A0A2U1EWF5_9PSEU|nr:LCP family protein [Actinomycetospora cinnamomea]PVZ04273.1 LytR family transcriptional attenuator [Actinomycetospora cinnamomea]
MSIGSVMDQQGAGGPDPEERGRRRRGLRALAYGLIGLLVLVLLAAAGIVLVTQHLGSQVGRYPSVFAPIDPSSRPSDSAGQTFLLMGTDTRSPDPTTGTDAAPDAVFGSQRSDVIMVATIAGDGQSASVVSIPRDSWVDIPGHGRNKINAAYAFGGPPLLIQTVEQLSRVHVDHFAVIDFAGFAQMTDAVGGIDVSVGQQSERDGVVVPAGEQHLNGEQALVYVRDRENLPGGDFDRVKRQQAALRAFVQKALSSGTLSSPTSAYALVDTVTRHVGVDDSLTTTGMAQLAFGMRDLRNSAISFLTVPSTGTGTEGDQSVVYLDDTAGRDLWFAVNTDAVPEYVAAHPQEQLSDTPR